MVKLGSPARRAAAAPSTTRASGPPLWSLLTYDLCRPLPAAVFAVLYVLTRLPWIGIGYGADPDAARVAISAHYFWEHGELYPSRLPGYPLYEVIATALYPLGPLVMNAATLVVSFIGVLIFAALLRRLRIEPKGLLTVTFAFTPMIWINSSVSLDYLWALTLLLATYYALVRWLQDDGEGWRGPLIAGIFFGLALGCRPTAALMALPFGVLLLRRRNLPGAVAFCIATAVVAVIAFIPIWPMYGTHFLDFFDVRPTWKRVARTLGVEAFGMVTMAGILLTVALSWRRVLRLPSLVRRDAHLGIALLTVLLFGLSFTRLPLEEAYLTPAVPFILILVARLLSRPAVVAVCGLIVMGSLVDFHTGSDQGWRRPDIAIREIRPQPGRVLVDRALRIQREKVAEGMRTLDLPPNSVITAGFYYPIFLAKYQDELTLNLPEGVKRELIGPLTDLSESRDERNVVYVWLMRPAEARRYRAEGYQTYTMDLDGSDVLLTFETYHPAHERFAADGE